MPLVFVVTCNQKAATAPISFELHFEETCLVKPLHAHVETGNKRLAGNKHRKCMNRETLTGCCAQSDRGSSLVPRHGLGTRLVPDNRYSTPISAQCNLAGGRRTRLGRVPSDAASEMERALVSYDSVVSVSADVMFCPMRPYSVRGGLCSTWGLTRTILWWRESMTSERNFRSTQKTMAL